MHICMRSHRETALPLKTSRAALEHERSHRVRSELSTHCPTNGLPCHAPLGADKEYVLCIIHMGTAVSTRLIVCLFKALQVRIKVLVPGKSRLQRSSNPYRWRTLGFDSMPISRSAHHVISFAISRGVRVFLFYGWLPSSARFPVGLSNRWAPCEAERAPVYPSPSNLMAVRSPGPTQHSSTQFGILRQLTATMLLSAMPLCQ